MSGASINHGSETVYECPGHTSRGTRRPLYLSEYQERSQVAECCPAVLESPDGEECASAVSGRPCGTDSSKKNATAMVIQNDITHITWQVNSGWQGVLETARLTCMTESSLRGSLNDPINSCNPRAIFDFSTFKVDRKPERRVTPPALLTPILSASFPWRTRVPTQLKSDVSIMFRLAVGKSAWGVFARRCVWCTIGSGSYPRAGHFL